jgi:tRNA(Arg) A34 adenosine deaminase TadA
MCATAIRWAGFREYIYATSTDGLLELNWPQVRLSSRDLFKYTDDLPGSTTLIGDVAANDTKPLFQWQFQKDADCPSGCSRSHDGKCTVE